MNHNKTLENSLSMSHHMIKKIIVPGDKVVDATAGNGNDTVFLSQLVGEQGCVYSFDIQDEAIKNTKERLQRLSLLDRVTIIKDSHEHMDKYVPKGIKAVMFNLGYLPGGQHNISTKADTTIKAIEKGLQLIIPNGLVVLVVYHGGNTGFEEKDAVVNYVKTLDYKEYTVLTYQFINQINDPPIAVCIEKLK